MDFFAHFAFFIHVHGEKIIVSQLYLSLKEYTQHTELNLLIICLKTPTTVFWSKSSVPGSDALSRIFNQTDVYPVETSFIFNTQYKYYIKRK